MSTDSTHPIKVGFVGLSTRGWASTTLGPALVQPALRDRYTLTAVSTSSDATSVQAASKWSADSGKEVKGYSSATALLEASGDIDLAAVSVKAPFHKEIALPFIRAGKDIFIEWPVGTNPEETREIAAEAKKYGVRTLIGFQGRHSPVINKVKEIIASGKIGKVLSTNFIGLHPREVQASSPEIKEEYLYLLDGKNGVNLLTIPVGHTLELFTNALGDFETISANGVTHFPVATVIDSATGKPTGETRLTTAGPDHISITGVLKSGVLVNMTWRGGIKATTPGRRVLLWEIDGEEGSIRLESSEVFGAFIPYGGDPKLFVNGEKVEVEGTQEGVAGMVTKNWVEFAKGDGEGTHATIDDAVRIKRLIEAIDESLASGRRVSV